MARVCIGPGTRSSYAVFVDGFAPEDEEFIAQLRLWARQLDVNTIKHVVQTLSDHSEVARVFEQYRVQDPGLGQDAGARYQLPAPASHEQWNLDDLAFALILRFACEDLHKPDMAGNPIWHNGRRTYLRGRLYCRDAYLAALDATVP